MDVLLVGLGADLDEMRSLIDSAGYHLSGVLVQRRAHPDPRYFIGKGKLEELKAEVERAGAKIAVFAGTLRPSQLYALEKALHVQCYDRLRVILEIFTQRAHSGEARLQVEMAMLRYEIPILKEWIHSAAAGERPGFMAGGEYRVDAYYETVKRRMKKVRDELEAVRNERAFRRDHRQKRRFHHVSIAGYANAGKSSLFNALSGERVQVDDRLFTTLSTTTRALENLRGKILLTDTVGLVSDVPLWLVDAFRATFEEVFASDLVLLLVDASDPIGTIQSKIRLAEDTLLPGMDAARVQPVLTKVDQLTEGSLAKRFESLRNSSFTRAPLEVSVLREVGLAELRTLLVNEFQYPMELTVEFPQSEGGASFVSWIHEHADVLAIKYPGNLVQVQLRCREQDAAEIQRRAELLVKLTATSG